MADSADSSTAPDAQEADSAQRIIDHVLNRAVTLKAILAGAIAMISQGEEELADALIYAADDMIDDVKGLLNDNYPLLIRKVDVQ